jgi:LmbE family N-acetylglucosaminyl deacetylase
MRLAGVRELVLLAEEDSRLEDQRLFLNLAAAYSRLEKLVERVRPEAIATLAYEGGHPDHDSCSVLGARLGEQFGVKVWEAPLYSRGVTPRHDTASGDLADRQRETQPQEQGQLPHIRQQRADVGHPTADMEHPRQDQPPQEKTADVERPMLVQRFICETGDEALVEIGEGELGRKRAMCAQYASQGDFLRTFNARREVVRPQVRYEYGMAPHPGRTNYEQWQWWMSARDVSAKFVEFLVGS